MIVLQSVFWVAVLLILYTYLGYPLEIYLRSRRRSEDRLPENVTDSQLPSITVFIPVHNEEKWIARKIENTLALQYPRDKIRIVVASDGCTDQTVPIAARYSDRGVEARHNPNRLGKMGLMNHEIPMLGGEILLVTDVTAQLPPEALRLMALHFSDPRVGCVTGPRVCLSTESAASEGEGLYWRYESWIKRSESRLGACLGANGQVMAVRKSLFPQIPDITDDFYVPLKILVFDGAKVLFEPRAKAFIPAAANLWIEWKRKIRTNVAFLRNLRYLKSGFDPRKSDVWWPLFCHHMLRRLVPYAMLLSFFFALALWRVGSSYRIMAVVQLLFYALAALGWIAEVLGARVRVLYIPFYFAFANSTVLLAWLYWLLGADFSAWTSTERIMPHSQSPGQATPGESSARSDLAAVP